MLPARVDAHLATPVFVGVLGQIAWSASAGQARHGTLRRVSERHFAGREGKARPNLRNRSIYRPLQGRQFSALRDENSILTFGEDSLDRSPRPIFVPGQGGQRLRPVSYGFVRPGDVLSALLSQYS